MKYETLGPLRVIDGDHTSAIGARKIETVLAVLLIKADQVVTSEQLINEVWGDQIPRRATAGLHVYISQLRKFLSRENRPGNPVVTRPTGYLLHRGTDEIDFQSFLHLAAKGRTLARERQHEEALETLEAALSLWRGAVFGDLRSGAVIGGFVAWLAETRLECLEMLADLYLEVGRHREMVGRLYSLTVEHPLREAFYRQLMLALYRSERQADALRVYQTARGLLHDELAVEPCRALRNLHHAILAADDRLDFHAAPA